MLGNSLCIAKTTSLFLGLRDTFDVEVSHNQGFSPTTYSLWKDTSVVVTIVAIWLEGGNTQGGEKLGHIGSTGLISRRRGILAGQWGSKKSGHNWINWRAM